MVFLRKISPVAFVVVAVIFFLLSNVDAAPPHPQLIEELENSNQDLPYYIENFDEIKEQGVCSPGRFVSKDWLSAQTLLSPSGSAPFRILAILVKFSDHTNSVTPAYFDSLVFSANGSTVRSYFSDISYTQIDLVTLNLPSALGWRTAPQTYAYYVNNQNGLGAYPHNSQKLVEDLTDQINPLVNFANYDNDGDGYVDVLLVIHSGVGAEFSGSNNDIWSHKWAISPRPKDGVNISSFTMQPEFWVNPGDMTIGVYAHELCHGFGLPDLYDLDQSSNGIGRWCVMANGCWNGPYPGGSQPAHPCAWSRIEMGFKASTNVTTALNGLAIGDVKTGGPIFRLWTCGMSGSEYFLAENRQKIGYDSYLPQGGLLIWHIDDAKASNVKEWFPGLPGDQHYKVALEQADGLFELEHRLDVGDQADPFPGTGNRTAFNGGSSPNSNAYTSGLSYVGIQNISVSGNNIIANLTSGKYGCCCGITGDVNGDGDNADMLDVTLLVEFVFRNSGNYGPCFEESDINADNLGPNILDLTFLLDKIFRGGLQLPLCS